MLHDVYSTLVTDTGYLGCKQNLSHAVNDNLGLENS
jgi:hypothetical protein